MKKLIFQVYKKLIKKNFLINFFPIYKNINWILWEKQRKVSKKTWERYQNLSEEEKNKKHQYSHEWYRNRPEDKKQKKLVEYGKNYSRINRCIK